MLFRSDMDFGTAIGKKLDENPIVAGLGALLTRAAPALLKTWNAAKAAAPSVARGAGAAAKGGTKIVAKNAPSIAGGYAIYDMYNTAKEKLGKAADEVFDDPNSLVSALKNYAGDIASKINQGNLLALAQAATTFALPLGVVLAIIYGGKKLIDKVLS